MKTYISSHCSSDVFRVIGFTDVLRSCHSFHSYSGFSNQVYVCLKEDNPYYLCLRYYESYSGSFLNSDVCDMYLIYDSHVKPSADVLNTYIQSFIDGRFEFVIKPVLCGKEVI